MPRARLLLLVLGGLGAALLALPGLLARRQVALWSPRPSLLLTDRSGRLLGERPGEGGELGFWPVAEVPPERIVEATLIAEDRHFHEHPGVRWQSVLRAAWQDVRAREVVSGASTIPMQVARMQHPAARTVVAKVREAAEALALVGGHGHQEVLRQYLRLAPYGNRVRGAARAARLYFDVPLSDLSWRQAAFLAALPQMPGRMNPFNPEGLRRASARADRILLALHAAGRLDDESLRLARESDLGLIPRAPREPSSLHPVLHLGQRLSGTPGDQVTTSLDLEMQRLAAGLLESAVLGLRGAGAENGAVLVADVETGEVLVHVGSVEYGDARHHGATDFAHVPRAPGSTLKPFIHALALDEARLTPASVLPDAPLDVQSREGDAYLPENVDHVFRGPMLMRQALGNSRNLPALRALERVGVERAARWLSSAGLHHLEDDGAQPTLGLALGDTRATLEELVGAYRVLAREGRAGGTTWVPGRPQQGEPRRLLGVGASQAIRHMLGDPIARRPTFPAGTPLDFDQAVAVKTGTSQGHRDAWAVGFSDRLVAGVWVGRSDGQRMDHITGARGAAQVLHGVLVELGKRWHRERPTLTAFDPPRGWLARPICALSGQLAGPHCAHSRTEWFQPGTEPAESCPWHHTVALDRRNGLRAGPSCPKGEVVRRPMLDLPAEYATWARGARLDVAPIRPSPLCPDAWIERPARLAVVSPRPHARFLFDPDSPERAVTLHLEAEVEPPDEQVTWLVDGAPVARVGWPFEVDVAVENGPHRIEAVLGRSGLRSRPVPVEVRD